MSDALKVGDPVRVVLQDMDGDGGVDIGILGDVVDVWKLASIYKVEWYFEGIPGTVFRSEFVASQLAKIVPVGPQSLITKIKAKITKPKSKPKAKPEQKEEKCDCPECNPPIKPSVGGKPLSDWTKVQL